ncbi:MAG: PASTA domain-containing protein [Clostridia bacterium]|nr:PASTA domain-containing protein [Clostridia bacterium]MCI9413476.1 PASTA domain-containing protein [Clostridia bacterium]
MSRVKKLYTTSKKLTIIMLAFFALLLLLIIRLGFIQFAQGAELKEKMYNQLITSRLVDPSRGTIYDVNGKTLAVSAPVDTITINPKSIVVLKGGKLDEEATKTLKEKVAKAFSDIFEIDYEATLKKVSSENSYETIIRKVDKDKVDVLKNWMKEEKCSSGINIEEDTKRSYPYENLASSLIGFCGNDNQGLYGLELYWDNILTGTPGKVVTSQDAFQDFIPDENQTYIPAENGYDLTLTIDANIQAIVEKYLKKACIENGCERGGNVIAMDPKTGDILAMATYPDYNLNTPFEMPSYLKEKDWKKMSSEEQTKTLYSVYRNRAVSDTYEPGSVFKIISAAVALEEDKASTDKAKAYYCKSYETVSGIEIDCAHRIKHGYQSLRDALAHSCNPSFIQLGQKVGASTFYKYYDAFGLFQKTGIETAEENGSPIFWNVDKVGPIELATMSFGQRFKITPLQMITAVSSVANNGMLMKPRIVSEMKNTDNGAVTTIDPVQVRQVISKETAEEVLSMMETVVTSGTGRYAQIKGYSIGGKTGTSEPDPGNPDEGLTFSFVSVSPVENPEIVMLVTLYNPTKGNANSVGTPIAAIASQQMLKEILPYMQIPVDSTNNTSSNATTLPNVTNKTVAEAKKILKNAGFTCSTSGKSDELVTDQFPVKGSQLTKDSIVKLYTETENTRVSKKVPDLMNKNLSQVKEELKKRNLNLSVTGSGIVVSQDPLPDTAVEEGTIIKVTMGK